MTSEASSVQSGPNSKGSDTGVAEVDSLERQLDRRDWLFRTGFYIPLLSIALFFLFANSTLREADSAVTGIKLDAEAAGIKTDDASGIDAARAIGTFAAAARDVRPGIPFPQPESDPDGAEISRAIRLAVKDLSRVKQLMLADQPTVEPGSIPNAVQTLLERCEVKPTGPVPGTECTSPPPSDSAVPVYFSFGRADLTPDNRAKLMQVVASWNVIGRPPVQISAYTDAVGGAAYNDSLRGRRAQAVRDALNAYSTSKMVIERGSHGVGDPEFPGFKNGDNEYRRVVVISFVKTT